MPFDAGGDSRDVLIPIAKLLSYSDSESAHIGLTIAVDRCALREPQIRRIIAVELFITDKLHIHDQEAFSVEIIASIKDR